MRPRTLGYFGDAKVAANLAASRAGRGVPAHEADSLQELHDRAQALQALLHKRPSRPALPPARQEKPKLGKGKLLPEALR